MVEADLDPGAVTDRLRTMARLLAERGFVAKGVDMSPPAVTDRLRTLSALSEACRRLAQAGASARGL